MVCSRRSTDGRSNYVDASLYDLCHSDHFPIHSVEPGSESEGRARMKMVFLTFGLLLSWVAIDLYIRGLHRYPQSPAWTATGGDPYRGKQAILRYGCLGCHEVAGIRDSRGRVGPQISNYKQQIYIAGLLPNTPENLISWIKDPQQHNPATAMPNLGVSDQDARDIAAYLYRAN